MNATQQFREALAARGIVPDEIIADGMLHRCDVEGKRGKGDGAYVLHLDGAVPAGGFQNWRDGLGWQDWRADIGRPLLPSEKAELQAKAERDRQQRQADEAKRHEEARKICAIVWNKAALVDPEHPHPYLAKKGVLSHGLRVTQDGRLIVPLRDANGTLHSLQFIDENGRKLFKTGGRKHGCYYSIGKPNGVLCLAEGYATGASIHEATGHAVAIAFDAGNLLPVARAMRAKMPDVRIVICADDDWRTEGNPGLTKAREAAEAVGGVVALPHFEGERGAGDSDFNDLVARHGREAVKEAIEKALASASTPVIGEPSPAVESPPSGQEDTLVVPTPLPKLPDVPDFPLEILPDGLRPLVALGSVIGRKLGIRLKQRDDWTEYANIWGALVGQPSTLKSPSMREALRPFKALQEAANARYRDELAEYETQSEAFNLRRNARKKAVSKALEENPDAAIDLSVDAPVKPIPRAYWTSDATAERLGELLAENPNGLLVERDELSSLLIRLEDESQATARGLYLSGWSGNEGFRFDRIGRGMTLIPKFALSVLGGIQPGPLSRYVRGAFSGERADGMLQRFQLTVWPDAGTFEYIDRYPDKEAKEKARAVFQYANDFDPETLGQHDTFRSDQPPFIHLSEGAQGRFREWMEDFMRERRDTEAQSENSPLAAHFGKYPGLVGKLALILHVADNPSGREVSETTLLKAMGWIQYLMPHARRVYHAVEHPETGAAELLLVRLKRGELPSAFTARDIYRKCWHGLSERDSVRRTCQLLFDYGWLIELRPKGDTGGRPSDTVYAVSPLAGGVSP